MFVYSFPTSMSLKNPKENNLIELVTVVDWKEQKDGMGSCWWIRCFGLAWLKVNILTTINIIVALINFNIRRYKEKICIKLNFFLRIENLII